MKAIILAAGMGQRLRDHHDLPKGFIHLGNKSIIEESIEKLRRHGIHSILIVTGYEHQHYDDLASVSSDLFTIRNEHYAHSGSLFSLFCAKHWIDEDFLLLDSDIIYDAIALEKVLKDPRKNLIVVSGETHSSDEVYIEARDSRLINMSKKLEELNTKWILGEFVGITKISFDAYQQLLKVYENKTDVLQNAHYETDGLVELAKYIDLQCLKIPELIWCEIDDFSHWQRAKGIYESLKLSS
jgi:choline kinase